MYKILVVEDDGVIADVVRTQLAGWGYEVRCVEGFKDIIASFAAFAPQLVLMDISLPFFSGYHWCREIRKISKVPVIFISSASDNLNIVMAMNMGGDDFIAKPFDIGVLVAKVQALLRRAYEFEQTAELIEHRGAFLNIGEGSLLYQDQRVELTKNEFRILKTLMERKGRTVPREEIMQRLWESDSYVDDNTLTVNINRLRHKLDELGLEGFITTKKGVGYAVEGL